MIASKKGIDRGDFTTKAGAYPIWVIRDSGRSRATQIRLTRKMVVTRNRSYHSPWLLMLAVPLLHPAGTLHVDEPDRSAWK